MKKAKIGGTCLSKVKSNKKKQVDLSENHFEIHLTFLQSLQPASFILTICCSNSS